MFAAEQIEYGKTGYYSKIVLDYLEGHENLKSYYSFTPDIHGITEAIKSKQKQTLNRNVLVEVLKDQYTGIETSDLVLENIHKLSDTDTFTICTAHQPNLLTGPLYFIYKISHAIKLAQYLNKTIADYHFIPLFYMGSEDADFEELNHFQIRDRKYTWHTDQKGAVGRMKIDLNLLSMLDDFFTQIKDEPFGESLIELIQTSFQLNSTIQHATLKLINKLFGSYGLIILIADDPRLKALMKPIFQDDLVNNQPSSLVNKTLKEWGPDYKSQAKPRNINLFYLRDQQRDRIEYINGKFVVTNSQLNFSKEEVLDQLQKHPKRFSPNVVLRALYQESILPNIAFIGGGGELAYWLQLKKMFDYYKVTFPALVLRNSFLIIPLKEEKQLKQINLNASELFQDDIKIINRLLELQNKRPALNGELKQLEQIYEKLTNEAALVDNSLKQHVASLKKCTLNQLKELEKKMLRAERKKNEALVRKVKKSKQQLFPNNSLQERVQNFSEYYSKWGPQFISELVSNSHALEQKFTILTELQPQS